MTTLDRIREYAKNNKMIFRDYRKDSFIKEDPECRYQLLWVNGYSNFKKFNTQQEIIEFLEDEENN